ncbi:MAG TPA: acyl-CoA dehydrogenase family protein [Steroidobacteraceae bacterium]|nr:acyl-CoA dehydrogenase family protein [Steroidobacteraceae bacterium]
MDLSLTDEQDMLRDGVRRFVAENYEFEKRRSLAASDLGYSLDHWRTFAELGWLALGLPEDAGGLGGTLVDTALVMEAFGAALVLEPYASNVVLSGRILERADNQELRSRTLTALAQGRERVALAHFERESRYSLSQVDTAAARQGSDYVIRGCKSQVLDGAGADRLIVSARLGDALALFLIDRHAAGIEMESYRLLDDTRAAEVMLRDVKVGASSLLMSGPNVAAVLEEAIDRLILAKLAESLGGVETALEITAEYLRSRIQFGQPLIKFQAVQHRLAEMFVEVQEMRSILYCGLAHIDAEVPERRRAVSAAKVIAGGAGRLVAGLAIQLHGGIGMTEEYRVGHYFKKMVTMDKLFGDGDYHLARLASGGC